jgi:hypothetical protein
MFEPDEYQLITSKCFELPSLLLAPMAQSQLDMTEACEVLSL